MSNAKAAPRAKKPAPARVPAPPPPPLPEDGTVATPERALLLREAERLICGDRNAAYGEPDQDFQRTAAIWSVMFDRPFTGHEVALAMVALKLSRLSWSPGRYDSWVDVAGYAGCGWDCAVAQEKRKGAGGRR